MVFRAALCVASLSPSLVALSAEFSALVLVATMACLKVLPSALLAQTSQTSGLSASLTELVTALSTSTSGSLSSGATVTTLTTSLAFLQASLRAALAAECPAGPAFAASCFFLSGLSSSLISFGCELRLCDRPSLVQSLHARLIFVGLLIPELDHRLVLSSHSFCFAMMLAFLSRDFSSHQTLVLVLLLGFGL